MATSTGNCKATTRGGRPCQAFPVAGSDFCFWHDPSRAAQRTLARKKGGRARHGRRLSTTGEIVKLGSVADVVALLEGAVGDLLELENSVARARAVATLAGVVVKALEVSELEDRIARLEDKVGTGSGRARVPLSIVEKGGV